jgi:putative glutamine amidotransferase
MKKIVGITCGRKFKDGVPHRNYVNSAYCLAVAAAGALSVLLPVGDAADATAYLDRIDGLLLPGGIDVEPIHYGHERHAELGETDDGHDRFEIAVAREAYRRRLPILAICRGIQLLNVALGGTLIQDLPSEAPSNIDHRQTAARPEATHEILVDCESRLYSLTGERMAVNSFHHQSVGAVAPGLRVVGRSADGVVEALESDAHPHLLAVQCHPEEMALCDPISLALFQQFVAWL